MKDQIITKRSLNDYLKQSLLMASFKIEISYIVSTEWANLSISTFSKGLNLFKLLITQNLFVVQK